MVQDLQFVAEEAILLDPANVGRSGLEEVYCDNNQLETALASQQKDIVAVKAT